MPPHYNIFDMASKCVTFTPLPCMLSKVCLLKITATSHSEVHLLCVLFWNFLDGNSDLSVKVAGSIDRPVCSTSKQDPLTFLVRFILILKQFQLTHHPNIQISKANHRAPAYSRAPHGVRKAALRCQMKIWDLVAIEFRQRGDDKVGVIEDTMKLGIRWIWAWILPEVRLLLEW